MASDHIFRENTGVFTGDISILQGHDRLICGLCRDQSSCHIDMSDRVPPCQSSHRIRARAPGRAGQLKLLELIAKTGSISAAARAMDMSYRRAWLLIDEVNNAMKAPVVLTATGGAGGGGAALTPLGETLIAAYREIEADATEIVAKRIDALTVKKKKSLLAGERR